MYPYNVQNISLLTSDKFKETVYHELTHTAHYEALGNSWYTSFVDAEITEIVSHFGGTFSPYGNGQNGGVSAKIALEESWAYYIGHFLANRQYGFNSSTAYEQGIAYNNNAPVAGLNSHLNLLEDFSPFRTNDPFHWIPQGLYYDMVDNRNDIFFNPAAVNDNVLGYTNQQMFNAFQSTIFTLQDYRVNLLQHNGNNQAVEVTNLFNQYGY